MQETSYVLTEDEEIDSVVHLPINDTRRIKYTCFTTSENYIAIGSTSGSIYLFSRKPCSFLYLMPLSEGSICLLQISSDEKFIAAATVRGVVCLMTLKLNVKLIGTSYEHVGAQVNCFCWHDNSTKLYIGDAQGKVSIIINSIFNVNGMFQTSTCILMTLDSNIIQMSYDSALLVISTLTRAYICDTSSQQYKQIGNQLRCGEQGVCFFKHKDSSTIIEQDTRKMQKTSKNVHIFNSISDDRNLYDKSFINIYCARPGTRLWEVNSNGIVVKTHKFKEVLGISSQHIYKLFCPKSIMIKKTEKTEQLLSFQFHKLFVLEQKYIVTYSSTGMYLIDPVKTKIILWTNEIKDISSLSIASNKIYVMTTTGNFRCIDFISVYRLILKLYEKKLFDECLQAISLFKIQVFGKNEVVDENYMKKLVDLIKVNNGNVSSHRFSGIVVVNSKAQNLVENNILNIENTSTVLTNKSKNYATLENNNANIKGAKENRVMRTSCQIEKDFETTYSLIDKLKLISNDEELLQRIHEIQNMVETTKKMCDPVNDNSLVFTFKSVEHHCNFMLLKNISPQLIEQTNRWDLVDLVKNIFVDVNAIKMQKCSCGYPMFNNCKNVCDPELTNIGITLIRKFRDANENTACMDLCMKVPFLWKEIISCSDKNSFNYIDIVKGALVSGDKLTVSIIFRTLDKRRWNTVMKLIKTLEAGKCLYCDKTVIMKHENLEFDWNEMIKDVNKHDGVETASKLMCEINDHFPNENFNTDMMRQLIFSKILNKRGFRQAIDLNNDKSEIRHSISSTKIRDKIILLMNKDTCSTITKDAFGSGSYHWGMKFTPKNSVCPCCTLTLQTPVLCGNNGIALFACGHAYHVNCMLQKKVIGCTLHSN